MGKIGTEARTHQFGEALKLSQDVGSSSVVTPLFLLFYIIGICNSLEQLLDFNDWHETD